jgi:CheY-like chemotaxis protein
MNANVTAADIRPDDPGDRELTRRALNSGSYRTDLRIVCDGEEALDYLLHRGQYSDAEAAPVPDLILLDLNMPRLGGQEVLKFLKNDPQLKSIPTVVLTTSHQEEDILRSYNLGCNSYIEKPVTLTEFTESIQQLGCYWFQLVTKPRHAA